MMSGGNDPRDGTPVPDVSNTKAPGRDGPPQEDPGVAAAAVFGVGCVTAVAGFFSGGMIAVLIGKIAGWATRCEPLEGTPACNWHWYALIGGLIGLVSLPSISIWRLKGRRK